MFDGPYQEIIYIYIWERERFLSLPDIYIIFCSYIYIYIISLIYIYQREREREEGWEKKEEKEKKLFTTERHFAVCGIADCFVPSRGILSPQSRAVYTVTGCVSVGDKLVLTGPYLTARSSVALVPLWLCQSTTNPKPKEIISANLLKGTV